MEDRASKFRKFIERLPRLCSPTICGTLSQPTTRTERNNRTPTFEWSLEQKAILSPANITTANCSDLDVVDHSFLHQESEQFFSQKCIAPSPMTTPSTRPYSRSQPPPKNWSNYMFDERDEDETSEDGDNDDDEDEEDDEDDEDEHQEEFGANDCSMMSATSDMNASNLNDSNPVRTQAPRIRGSRRRTSKRRDSDTDIEMDVLDDQTDIDTDSDKNTSCNDDTDQDDMTDVENNNPDDHKSDEDHDDDDDDNDDNDDGHSKGHQNMDNLFLSPPMRSSQSQQRFDIFSPQTFDRVMDDESTLQSTPKTAGSQIFRPRVRRVSDMSD